MARDYKTFFAICKALGLDKEEVVFEFTGGETKSLSALNDGEWKELMIQLRKRQPARKPTEVRPGDAQRKKMIAIAGKMNWGTNTMEVVGKLNEWLRDTYGKELNEFEVTELKRIVWVMENKIYKDYLKRV